MSEPDWNDIRIFLALFRGRSVRRAAENLDMSHSTVSRHLTDLETSLGAVLFTRSRDGLLATDMAERILAKAEAVENDMIDLTRTAVSLDSVMSGPVRVTCPPLLSQIMIMPMIAEFTKRYPDIEVSVHSSYSFEDLMRGTADIALRSQFDPNDNLVGRRLPDFTDYTYASKDYIGDHWFEGDATNANWLGRGGSDAHNKWIKQTPFPNASVRHDFPDMMDQAQAAAAGMGMTVLPCYYGDQLPNLVRVPGTQPVSKRPIWALTHPDLRTSVRIKTFLRFLVTEISKQEAQITGELGVDT
ncbi:MAG: LysR family transcriptional regulator [Rhodobacteraceae bacterium]|nr:LysR family transcriptional regulator [Paracoccaceae bacterium]